MNICTIIAKNYVSHARVLCRSFRRRHPDGRCWVLVVDDHEGFLDPAEEPFELVGIDEIGLPEPERMAAAYDVTEFSTAVKPWLLRHLLGREGVDSIAYLDPDIWIADSLAEVERLAVEHGIVLTPHFTAPLPRDGLRPREEDIMIAGAYNLGFIGLGAGEDAERLLDWWSERLERHCVVNPADGLFVDQRWIDLVPGIWPSTEILRDPGYNVAYWNLPARELERRGDGYAVDGSPLRFLHFSGFDPRRPERLSKHQDRIEIEPGGALDRACRDYAAMLIESGFEEARSWSYGWSELPNGVRMDQFARRLFREAEEAGALEGSVFEPAGAAAFVAYLNQTGAGGVSRFARAVYDSRADLREAFPDVDGRDAAAYGRWFAESAASLGAAPPLRPKRRAGAARADGSRRANGANGHRSNGDGVNGHRGNGGGARGVNLCGYLSSELGVGEAARQLGSALEAAGLPAAPIDVPVEEAHLPREFATLGPEHHPFDVNLICVNADMLPVVAREAPPTLFEERRSAGLWFWEVERFPERWRGSFEHVDEVWTASEFVAEALRPLADVPVRTIRVPVTPGDPAPLDRRALSMPDGFCFLFVFDYRSVFHRKNPLAAVDAFRRAFEPGEGASLLIKSVAGDTHPGEAERLAAAAAEHADVHLLDGVVSAAEKNAMIAASDCYVSLHRSEGLGLTMAEAMYFGKPVIATGYSGNLDFMDAGNSFLVDHSLERIGEGAGPYPPSARWAEPDVEHAAELMREVFEDRERAAEVGERAAEDIRSTHSPEAAGRLLGSRLAEIRGAGEPPAPAAEPGEAAVPVPVREGRARLHHLLAAEQPPARLGAGRLRALLKRAYMRLLHPYAAYQREIDLSMRDSIDETMAEMAALERRCAAATEASEARLREEIAAELGRGDHQAR